MSAVAREDLVKGNIYLINLKGEKPTPVMYTGLMHDPSQGIGSWITQTFFGDRVVYDLRDVDDDFQPVLEEDGSVAGLYAFDGELFELDHKFEV